MNRYYCHDTHANVTPVRDSDKELILMDSDESLPTQGILTLKLVAQEWTLDLKIKTGSSFLMGKLCQVEEV